MTNVVVTSLLTSSPDPARPGHRWTPDPAPLAPLIASVQGARMVVLYDRPLTAPLPQGAQGVQVPHGGNPYHHRWKALDLWLRCTPWPTNVFAVDATDVQMLHQPWDHLEPDTLYVGSEQPDDEAHTWLVDTHPSLHGQRIDEPVLNAGICGGHRDDVARFAMAMTRDLATIGARDLTDMAAFNRVEAGCDVALGEPVHTRLHGHEDAHPTAWWRHK